MAEVHDNSRCDVQLEVFSAGGCDVRPIRVVRHLALHPGQSVSCCGTPLGALSGATHVLTDDLSACTCHQCFFHDPDGVAGVKEDFGASRKPRKGTAHPPQSSEKMAIMRRRQERHEAILHEQDASADMPDRGVLVMTCPNGAVRMVGIVAERGRNGVKAREDFEHSQHFEELPAPVKQLLSGESFLRKIEKKIGRALCPASRSMGAWPWGMDFAENFFAALP